MNEPCHGCPLWQRCADERLACKDFMTFVNSRRFRNQPEKREPSHEIYEQVFAMQPHMGRPPHEPETPADALEEAQASE